MTRTTRNRLSRHGFTLVEMLVAAALAMIIMTILAGAFQIGLETLRKLKVVAELQERMRTATIIMKRDLSSPHFGPGTNSDFSLQPWGGQMLSDQKMDRADWQPPREGYFRIDNGIPQFPALSGTPATNGLENIEFGQIDSDSIPSFAATNHRLSFTVCKGGTSADDIFTVTNVVGNLANPTASTYTFEPGVTSLNPPDFRNWAPASSGATLSSRWARVEYFLEPISGALAAGSTQLYSLRRRVRLLLAPNFSNFPVGGGTADARVDSFGTVYNSSVDVIYPNRRLALGLELDSSGNPTGGDILISDVISFEVKTFWSVFTPSSGTSFYRAPRAINAAPPATFDYPFDILPNIPAGLTITTPGYAARPRVFDTWAGTQDSSTGVNFSNWDPNNLSPPSGAAQHIPLRARVKTLQIRLRIWDSKTETTRQVTFVQDV